MHTDNSPTLNDDRPRPITHETAPASSLDKAGRGRGWVTGSRAQSPTDVQLRPRILPVRVRRQFAITTTRGMIPNSQRDGGMGPVTPAL